MTTTEDTTADLPSSATTDCTLSESPPTARLTVSVYSPKPLLGHPLELVKNVVKGIWTGRELAWSLFTRDVSAQYRQTALGYVWAFLPPLVAALIFIFLNSQGILNIDSGGIPYPAFVLIGTLLWQVFVDALQSPTKALIAAKPMLTKINFPREAILMSGLYMVVFNFLIRLVLVVAVMLWWGISPSSTVLFFPVAMGVIMLAGFAFGLAIAPLGGFYNDVTNAIPIVAQFWMLLTPVVYPARTEGLAGLLATWNPLSPLVTAARESLTEASLSHLFPFAVVAALALTATLVGLVAFRVAMPHLVARMGG